MLRLISTIVVVSSVLVFGQYSSTYDYSTGSILHSSSNGYTTTTRDLNTGNIYKSRTNAAGNTSTYDSDYGTYSTTRKSGSSYKTYDNGSYYSTYKTGNNYRTNASSYSSRMRPISGSIANDY